ncbi:MAG TPA: hypothetical protein VF589_07185 [Allosphingosinicella sp.]
MTTRPPFKLSRLRDIGWSRWDPIGLSGMESTPDDEYDSYLLEAAGRLWNGASEEDVADYLVSVETRDMGLGDAPGVRPRAGEVVNALSGYLSELRG